MVEVDGTDLDICGRVIHTNEAHSGWIEDTNLPADTSKSYQVEVFWVVYAVDGLN